MAGLAIAGWLIVGLIAWRALVSGEESGAWQIVQVAAAFAGTIGAAAAVRWDDALVRCAVAFGGALVAISLVLDEASQATNDPAALPLASAGFYLLVCGGAIAAGRVVAGIRRGQR